MHEQQTAESFSAANRRVKSREINDNKESAAVFPPFILTDLKCWFKKKKHYTVSRDTVFIINRETCDRAMLLLTWSINYNQKQPALVRVLDYLSETPAPAASAPCAYSMCMSSLRWSAKATLSWTFSSCIVSVFPFFHFHMWRLWM